MCITETLSLATKHIWTITAHFSPSSLDRVHKRWHRLVGDGFRYSTAFFIGTLHGSTSLYFNSYIETSVRNQLIRTKFQSNSFFP